MTQYETWTTSHWSLEGRVMLEKCKELFFSGMTEGVLKNHQRYLINKEICWADRTVEVNCSASSYCLLMPSWVLQPTKVRQWERQPHFPTGRACCLQAPCGYRDVFFPTQHFISDHRAKYGSSFCWLYMVEKKESWSGVFPKQCCHCQGEREHEHVDISLAMPLTLRLRKRVNFIS